MGEAGGREAEAQRRGLGRTGERHQLRCLADVVLAKTCGAGQDMWRRPRHVVQTHHRCEFLQRGFCVLVASRVGMPGGILR